MSLKHGDSLLLNQEIKNKQTTAENQTARARGNPRWLLGFSQLLEGPHFYLMVKALPGYSVNAFRMTSLNKKTLCFTKY